MDVAKIILEKLEELYKLEEDDGLPKSDIMEAYFRGVRDGLESAIDEVNEIINKEATK